MGTFFLQTSSFIFLLMVASGVTYFAKIWKIPSTMLLVAAGILIALLANNDILPFMDDFQLTSGVLFYVLLPILLFESAYNIRYSDLLKNMYSIGALSLVSLLISALSIGTLIYFIFALIGFPLPYIIALLFGSLISATDTAAALSIFKEIGVPKRLHMIFEGESLFNDGTAIALFLVVLGVVEKLSTSHIGTGHSNLLKHFISQFESQLGNVYPFFDGIISLLSMISIGIIVGVVLGILFSKIIQKIQNETYLEITLSLALAHATFLIAEVLNHFFLPVSGIIATVTAAILLGNYGRYKISPKVEEVMEKYWGFFTFVSNSLIFILVGVLLVHLDVTWRPLVPAILCAIPIVIFSRFLSVFPVFSLLNRWGKEEEVPYSWQLLLSWAALRGAIAIMLVLLIPKDLSLPGWNYEMSIRDVLASLTIGVVLFSIFIKTLTVTPLIKRFHIDTLSEVEELLFLKTKLLLLSGSLNKIGKIREARYIDAEEGEILSSFYDGLIDGVQDDISKLQEKQGKHFGNIIKRIFSLHALAIEQKSLLRLYKKNEVNEGTFKKIYSRIRYQSEKIESGLGKIQSTKYIKVRKNRLQIFSEYILSFLEKKLDPIEKQYYEVRTLHIIIEKALEELKELSKWDFLSEYTELAEVIQEYEAFKEDAETTRRNLFKLHREKLRSISALLTKKSLYAEEEEIIHLSARDEIISEKIAQKLEGELHLSEKK